jgi:hypothetical protein
MKKQLSGILASIAFLLCFGCESSTQAVTPSSTIIDSLQHAAWDTLPANTASNYWKITSSQAGELDVWFAVACQPTQDATTISVSKDTILVSIVPVGTQCLDWTPTVFSRISLVGNLGSYSVLKIQAVSFARSPTSKEDSLGILDLTKAAIIPLTN